MDGILNKAKGMMNSSGSGAGNVANTNTNTNAAATDAGKEDYGDKGLAFLEKKTGHTMDRNTNEKITDGARGLYEKATGKKVDPKYSN